MTLEQEKVALEELKKKLEQVVLAWEDKHFGMCVGKIILG